MSKIQSFFSTSMGSKSKDEMKILLQNSLMTQSGTYSLNIDFSTLTNNQEQQQNINYENITFTSLKTKSNSVLSKQFTKSSSSTQPYKSSDIQYIASSIDDTQLYITSLFSQSTTSTSTSTTNTSSMPLPNIKLSYTNTSTTNSTSTSSSSSSSSTTTTSTLSNYLQTNSDDVYIYFTTIKNTVANLLDKLFHLLVLSQIQLNLTSIDVFNKMNNLYTEFEMYLNSLTSYINKPVSIKLNVKFLTKIKMFLQSTQFSSHIQQLSNVNDQNTSLSTRLAYSKLILNTIYIFDYMKQIFQKMLSYYRIYNNSNEESTE